MDPINNDTSDWAPGSCTPLGGELGSSSNTDCGSDGPIEIIYIIALLLWLGSIAFASVFVGKWMDGNVWDKFIFSGIWTVEGVGANLVFASKYILIACVLTTVIALHTLNVRRCVLRERGELD